MRRVSGKTQNHGRNKLKTGKRGKKLQKKKKSRQRA